MPAKRHSPAIEAHLQAIAEEVVALPDLALGAMHRDAQAAKAVIVAALSEWLAAQDPKSELTDDAYFALLWALRRQGITSGRVPQLPKWITLLSIDLRDQLLRATERASQKAIDHTLSQVAGLDLANLGAPAIEGVDVEAILAKMRNLLRPRVVTVSQQAASNLYDRTRAVLFRGVTEHETIEQMGARIGGPLAGDAGTLAEGVAAALFLSLSANLDRVVTTETMRAYNDTARATISALANVNPQLSWFKRWDSTLDLKVCPACRELHGDIVPLGREFPRLGGQGPPLHPRCRCICVSWAEERAANPQPNELAA